ncbi:MAG: hypothetical protein IPI44_11575 [Sulfuritalea sp.]|nr:hypothetical protein [Sulfuritalea sp.]
MPRNSTTGWRASLDAAPLVLLDTETTDPDPLAYDWFILSRHRRRVWVKNLGVKVLFCRLPAAGPRPCRRADAAAHGRYWQNLPSLESARHLPGQHCHDRHVFANHGVHLAGIAECDTLPQSYARIRCRTDLGLLAVARHCGLPTISYDAGYRQGRASRIPLPVSTSPAPPNTPPRMPTFDAALCTKKAPAILCEAELDCLYCHELKLPVVSQRWVSHLSAMALIDAATLARCKATNSDAR